LEEPGVHLLERLNQRCAQFLARNDEEIHIAVLVEIAHRNRAMGVYANQVGLQDLLGAGCQLCQHAVDSGGIGWLHRSPLLLIVAPIRSTNKASGCNNHTDHAVG
jgi:hypothetical protein